MAAKIPLPNSITPKNRYVRVSGLRRSATLGKTVSTTPIRTTTTTLQSDGKITVLKKIQTPEIVNETKRRTSSANISRPYNLALSKQVRETMTKKRLQFNLPENVDTEENKKENKYALTKGAKNALREDVKKSPIDKNHTQKKDVHTKEEYPSATDEVQIYMEQRQRHIRKVAELKKAIGMWKIGFCNALSDFQEKFQPHLSKEQLLRELRIDHQMIQYLND